MHYASVNASIWADMEPIDLALYGIDSATILKVYTWGFGSVLSAWATGYGVGVVVALIKKI